jgi:hypothetical protein
VVTDEPQGILPWEKIELDLSIIGIIVKKMNVTKEQLENDIV